MNSRVALWTLVAAACAWTCAATGRTSAQTEAARAGEQPRVTLPADADISQVVAELARAIDGVVVADVAVKDRRLTEALENATVEEALARISIDFDRHWVRRGRSIALQLRRSDPEEQPGAELPELLLAVDDLKRVLSAIPSFDSVPQEREAAQIAFMNSLTEAQRARLPAGGLPFSALSTDQQRTIMGCALAVIYGASAHKVRTTNRVVRSIDRASIRRDRFGPAPLPPDVQPPVEQLPIARSYISARVPDPQSVSLEAAVRVEVLAPGLAGEDRERVLQPSGETMPPPERRRTHRWELPPQRVTVGDLATNYRQLTGQPLRVPEYARQRQLWISSATSSDRLDVLQAVADLWGWESTAASRGRRLDRASFRPARDARELHILVPQAIPPYLMHASSRTGGRFDMRRRMADLRRVDAELRALARPGEAVPGGQLSQDSRWRLMSALLELLAVGWRERLDDFDGKPPSFVANPHGAALRYKLRGPLPPGDVPLLWFEDGKSGCGFPAYTKLPPLPRPGESF